MTENIISSDKILEQVQSLFQLYTKLDSNITNLSQQTSYVQDRTEDIRTELSKLHTEVELIKRDKNIAGYSLKVDTIEQRLEMYKDEIHRIDMLINTLKIFSDSSQQKWAKLFDLIFKIVVGVGIGYLLFVFGIGAPFS